jgi:hypothetical protein
LALDPGRAGLSAVSVNQGQLQPMRLMLTMLLTGLVLGGSGIGLLLFTDVTERWGIGGIGLVVGLITIGLFLILPAKIYLILRYTRARP